MASVEEFIKTPSDDLLDDFSKDQLLEVADHYEITLSAQDKRLKDTIKTVIKTELNEREILKSQSKPVAATSKTSELTFEQQKELLLIEAATKEKNI